MTEKARKFVAAHEAKLRPLEIAAGKAWWDANVTGKDEDFKRKERKPQNKIDEARWPTQPPSKRSRHSGRRKQEIQGRNRRPAPIDVIYLAYLEKQVEPELLKKNGRQGQRRGENVQHSSRQGGRQGDRRQRSPPGAETPPSYRRNARRSGKRARRSARRSRRT